MSLWDTLASGVTKVYDGYVNEANGSCAVCKISFPVRLRRHHCRACYRVVCGSCSSNSLPLSADRLMHRVCDTCFTKLSTPKVAEVVKSNNLSIGFSINVQNVEVLPPALNATGKRMCYCNIIHGDKILKTTQQNASCIWNETCRVHSVLSNPLESFVTIEVWEKRSTLSGDDCVAKCRVSLLFGDIRETSSDAWYPLIGKHHHLSSRIRVSITQDGNAIPLHLPLDSYSVSMMPGSDILSALPLELKSQRTIPLVVVFPPSVSLHKLLFLPLKYDTSYVQRCFPEGSNNDLTARDAPSPTSPPVIDFPNPKLYIPCNELLLETAEYAWMRILSSQSTKLSLPTKYYQGVLLTTSHRLVFIDYLNKAREPCRVTIIPHVSVAQVVIRRDWKEGFDALEILCADGISYIFACERRNDNNEIRLLQSFQRTKLEIDWRRDEDSFANCANIVALPEISDNSLGADYEHKSESDDFSAKKELCADDILSEFRRLGIENRSEWRISSVNSDYNLCESYPRHLVVPASVSDAVLAVAATQRSARRLPVLTWIHPQTGAALCRSSQPLTGINYAACPEDETLLLAIRATATGGSDTAELALLYEAVEPDDGNMLSSWTDIRELSSKPLLNTDGSLGGELAASSSNDAVPEMANITVSSKRLRIMDCRPGIYAKGNALLGKGHEVISRLGGQSCTTLEFAGIDNIHAMRKSYNLMRLACLDSSNPDYLLTVHQSKWLLHVSMLMRSSVRVAAQLDRGDPVLVHCSDGWDRTAQMTALAQLLLDPFYRTLDGFRILIFKDFVSFGHKFRARAGMKESAEGSPIFFQFLDAVWQVWRQYPWEFEFTERYLELLAYTAQSRFTCDFLYDTAMENTNTRDSYVHMFRNCLKSCPSHVSVWTHVYNFRHMYLNPLYCRRIASSSMRQRSAQPLDKICHVSPEVKSAMTNLNGEPCRMGGVYYDSKQCSTDLSMSPPCCGRGLAPALSRDELSEQYWPSHSVANDSALNLNESVEEVAKSVTPVQLFYATTEESIDRNATIPDPSSDDAPVQPDAHYQVYLLSPQCNVQQLAVWECMFQRGFPHGSTIAGASYTFANGMVVALRECEAEKREMLSDMQNLRDELNLAKRKIENLTRMFETPRHDSIDGETILVLKHDDAGWDVSDKDENCTILQTGSLIENYM